MDISFHHARDRQYYAIRFKPGMFETVPFIRELRFWGVDRFPCPRLSAMAALLVLKDHPMSSAVFSNAELNAPICSALSEFFGIEVYPSKYNTDRRELAGGDMVVVPARFTSLISPGDVPAGAEALTWMSLDDIGGPVGGSVRTNIDAFALTESEKNLVIALCCAGKEVGHVALDAPAPDLHTLFHWMGLELVSPCTSG